VDKITLLWIKLPSITFKGRLATGGPAFVSGLSDKHDGKRNLVMAWRCELAYV